MSSSVGRIALVLTLLLAVAPAAAQGSGDAAASLARARELLLYADYPGALAAVTALLEREDLDATQRNTALEVLATVHVAQRNNAAADRALAQLYARDPGHRLSDVDASPPVIAAFGRLRANPPPALPMRLSDRTEPLATRRAPEISVAIEEGADLVETLRLSYRHGGGAYLSVAMERDGALARAQIPVLDEADSYPVEYTVEARAPSGHVLARIASEAEPARLVVPARAGGLAVEAPREAPAGGGDDGVVIGVVIGVVAAALLAGGIVVAVALAGGGPQDGSLGNIELPLLRF
ncbi:MAG: hypothetical protein KF729_01590 [Sandaracinaceae bacterium]|nr:hypothetical protein [Sandaracinaceae bacterium]